MRLEELLPPGGGEECQIVKTTQQRAGPMPPGAGPVSITISWFEAGERRTTTVSGVAPEAFRSQWITLQLGVDRTSP